MPRSFVVCLALAAVLARPLSAQAVYDVVIRGGRVIDPESRLDSVRNVGIRGGRIAAISRGPLRGKQVIDARGPRSGARVHEILWGSRFQVHHKLADRFRDG